MLYGQVYIGDLGNDGTRYELEEAFSEYGSVKNIWVAKKPPGKQYNNYYSTSVRSAMERLIFLRVCLCTDG